MYETLFVEGKNSRLLCEFLRLCMTTVIFFRSSVFEYFFYQKNIYSFFFFSLSVQMDVKYWSDKSTHFPSCLPY